MSSDKYIHYIFNDFFGKEAEISRIGKKIDLQLPEDPRVTRPVLLLSEGEYAKLTAKISINAFGRELTINYPNLTSLYLSKRKRAYKELNKLWLNLKGRVEERYVDTETESLIYDFIECFQDVVIYSYASLEAFANLVIPDNFSITHKRKRDKTEKQYDKKTIQRYWSLSEKVELVLPKVFETEPPERKLIENFKLLESFRHTIIHNKDKDFQNIFKYMFNLEVLKNVLNSATTILMCFANSDQPIINAVIPYGFNENKLAILPVPNFDGLVEEK